MKKYSWIVALLLALSLVIMGCPNDGGKDDGGDEGELEWKVVFDFQDASKGIVPHAIQELPEGALSFPNKENNPIKPLVRAAEDQHASYEIIKVDGKNALKYVTHADWGPGFDLPNSVFAFREGDKITVTGKAEGATIDLAFNKNQGGAQNITGNRVTETGDFTVTAELSASDITSIKANEQKVLRFEDRAASDTTVTIYNIVIEGNRPTAAPTKLGKPTVTLAGTTITWTAVEGAGQYKVLALAEGATAAVTVTEPAAEATTYDLALSTLKPTKYTETAVKYSITVVAVGVPGVSSDSDPSDAVEFTKNPPAPPPLIKIKIGGVEKDAELYAVAGTFVEIKDGSKDVGYTFTRGAAYAGSYAYLKIDLGTAKLSDFSQVKFTYAGVTGDLSYKDIELRASATEPSGNIATPVVNKPRYDSWATAQSTDPAATGKLSFGTGFQANNDANNGTITLKVEPTLVSTLTGEVYIAIFFSANATGSFGGADSPTVHSISEIELVTADATNPIVHSVYFVTAATDGIALAIVNNVADKTTVSLPSPIPSTDFASFHTGWINLGAWKNKEGDTAFVPGTTQVVKDTVIYNVAP